MPPFLGSHFNAVEQRLLAEFAVAANAGHTVNRGTLRENFVQRFLGGHLGDMLAVGSGEIVDADSRPGEGRNQLDVVIYRRDFPKIDFGGSVGAFLAESVLATIEVKSALTKAELTDAIKTAHRLKGLRRSIAPSLQFGPQPPSILSYVVAYQGPALMSTVYDWLHPIHQSLGIAYPDFAAATPGRHTVPRPPVDGIFVLGKGFVRFANVLLETLTGVISGIPDVSVRSDLLAKAPKLKWIVREAPTGNLLWLFLILTEFARGFSLARLNLSPYLSAEEIGSISLGD